MKTRARRITRKDASPNVSQFVSAILQPAPDLCAWVTSFPDEPSSENLAIWTGHRYSPKSDLQVDGRNAYFSIALFPKDATSRKRQQAVGVAVILCEDVGSKADGAAITVVLGRPSFKIATSPGNEQWGYLLTRLATFAEVRAIHAELKKRRFTDQSGNNDVRYGRLPAGINNKPKHVGRDGKPFQVKCTHWDAERRFDPDGLMKLLGVTVEQPKKLELDFSKNPEVEADTLLAAVEWLPNDLIYDDWIRVGHALKKELGKDGYKPWMAFSKKYAEFDRTIAQAKWDSFKPTGDVTGRTVIGMAFDRGWKGPTREPWRKPLNIMEQAAAPPYSPADLPKILGDYAQSFSQRSGIDISIVAMSALIAAAATIDDRFRLYLGSTNWYESARLWAVTIAPSGSGKTPAHEMALKAIKDRHNALAQEWQHNVATRTDAQEDELPPLLRLFVTDTTIEALSEVLRHNARGILIHYDEFISMLGGFDAYRGGGGVSKDRGEYLKLFQGGPNQIERIKRGTILVPNWGASILAGTTATALQKLAPKLPDDGLLQRFLIAIGTWKLPVAHDDTVPPEVDTYYNTLLRMLRKEAPSERTDINMVPAALTVFRDWEADSRTRSEAAAHMSEGYASHVSKHAQMVARIALTFHFVETAHLDHVPPLTEGAMRLAIQFLAKADLHAMVLYTSMLSGGGPIVLAREVAKMILGRQIEVIQRRQLVSGVITFRDADDHLRDRAMRLLEDYGWIRPARSKYDTGHTTRWEVNPQIGTVFAEEAARERARRDAILEKIEATAAKRGDRS